MTLNISSESFVLFAGGKPYEAKLPARQILACGIDVRFDKPITGTFIIETAKAKPDDRCTPDTWEKYHFERVCGDSEDGEFTIKADKRGACRIALSCLRGDFIRVTVKTEGATPPPTNLNSILISLAVR